MNIQQKRAHFPKDLDKLVSGDYVLVPRQSAQFCAEKTIDHVHDNIREFGENPELESEWKAHAHALMVATGDTRYEN
ncbi:hypothetical protein [Acinetobacter pittii]|uniref:hypothetical protein n=1 Tax=Acinetobacter pittii TaxID=48296 RepID=UPI0012985D22|nr:hypothetical protein [Acinetobacter pittii]MRA45294.1 hypothetical protein [Acinetobacter pittii]